MITKGINSQLLIRLILGLLFIPFFVSAQKDTIVYQEINIFGTHKKIEGYNLLNEEKIQQLAPYDLGTLLQFINGITIKDYGGIGGMKTLSHRGLGGEHTQLVVDGIPISDPQNGQNNLANIQVNNLEEVKLSQQNDEQLVPVSALIKGSAVHLKTFDQQFSPHLLSLRSSLLIGSFGQKEAFVSLKNGGKRSFISLTGSYRDYEGNYPYRLQFGDEKQTYTRKNNALQEYHISVGGGYKWKSPKRNHTLKLTANTNGIDQQLPGAVVLYNDIAKETLKTNYSNVGLKYNIFSNDIDFNAFAQYAHRFLHYHDPNFNNIDGFIDNQYTTNSIVGGLHFKYKWNKFDLQAGNDFRFDKLASSRELGKPVRYSNTSMLRGKYNSKWFSVEASVFAQAFIDQNLLYEHKNNYFKIHPQLAIFTSDNLMKDVQLYAWYKPSSREPSFNELYYSQIGNKSLVPEESSQINLGAKFIKIYPKFNFQIQGNVFRNSVKEKIVALPTKNLFVWSIQNIGKVNILGADLNFNTSYQLAKNWLLSYQIGINYQRVIDVSDSNSPTYKHQIAYTPEFTGSTSLNIAYKKIGLHFSGLYIGERYSLNENTVNNHLDPYFILDISASYSIRIKEKHNLKLQAGMKNVLDSDYDFIRYYMMPGRNYFLKLSYEFN